MKEHQLLRRAGILLFLIIFGCLFAANPAFAQEEDFLWGVNGHGYQNNPTFPQERLDEQMRLAAELGVTCYRMNVGPSVLEDGTYDWY